MSAYRVRRVRSQADRDEIVRIHTSIFTGGRAAVPDLYRGDWWVVQHEDDGVVAFAGLTPSSSYEKTGYLIRGGVDWAHQGQGLQKRLIKARLRQAAAHGWPWVVTDTARDNCPSANSLISCGFRLFKPTRPWAGKGSLYWRCPAGGR